jgi:hypothetical protein
MDKIEKLKELKLLLESSIISKEEFEQLKKELMSMESEPQSIFINNNRINIEIYKKDLPKMTFKEAVGACKALGQGWMLPTIEELSEMYKLHIQDKGSFSHFLYWSQTEGSENAVYVINFGNGEGDGTPFFQHENGRQNHDKDYFKYFVRPVRHMRHTKK